MRRALLVAAGLAAFVAAHELAAPFAPSARLPAPAWMTLLGPLRPFFAELLRLRFEARRGSDRVLGQLDDAWSVLELAPERAAGFADFGAWFLFDAPRLAASAPERDACVRAGFEILHAGRAIHPRSARLPYVEAVALDQFARHAPERIAALALPAADSPRGRAVVLLEEALALAAPDDPDRAFILLELSLCTEGLLGDLGSGASLLAIARRAAERLLRSEPDLANETRAALSAALERASGR